MKIDGIVVILTAIFFVFLILFVVGVKTTFFSFAIDGSVTVTDESIFLIVAVCDIIVDIIMVFKRD